MFYGVQRFALRAASTGKALKEMVSENFQVVGITSAFS